MTNLYRIFSGHPSVTTDSRNIPAGSIFFALRGPNFDGNIYAAEALEKGAAYAVVDDKWVIPKDQAGVADGRYILVSDTLAALQALATEHRRTLGIPILAITGSNGKTTTKELTTRVLERKFEVGATKGNLNNHIGVPLTLLSFDTTTEFGIVEMGANNPGEIAALCRIAEPDFGLITNVGLAHLEGFGSPEGVLQAKAELYRYLADNNKPCSGKKAFVRAEDELLVGMGMQIGVEFLQYSGSVAQGIPSNLAGDYNRLNISAAVAIGRHFGVGEDDIRDAVAGYMPDNMRSQRVETGRNTVILDCYNANPSSMRSAIGTLRHDPSGLPVTVILGDMGELGDFSAASHNNILELLEVENIGDQYLVGARFATAAAEVPTKAQRKLFPDTAALGKYLESNPLSGRLILVKGSRATGLEKIAGLL